MRRGSRCDLRLWMVLRTTTCEERSGRSSWQVSRWVLHDLPSISGCQSKCCQPTNEAYHSGGLAAKKTGGILARFLKFRPLLPVGKRVLKGNLDRIGTCLPNRSIVSSGKLGSIQRDRLKTSSKLSFGSDSTLIGVLSIPARICSRVNRFLNHLFLCRVVGMKW